MEDSKLTNRLTLAVYLFLAALAVILALIGIKYIQNDSPTRNLILNLSTEILGVVIIFFIVNQLFLLNKERDFVKLIDSLKEGIKIKFSPLIWENDIGELFDFTRDLFNSKNVYLLGHTLANLLGKYRNEISMAIKKGINIKIIIIDVRNEMGIILRNNLLDDSDIISRDSKRTIKYINQINEMAENYHNSKGSLEIKIIKWFPSCSLIIFDNENENGIAKVRIYSPSIKLPISRIRENINLILKKEENTREFNYFKENFELLWEGKMAEKLTKEFMEEFKEQV